MGLEDRRTPTWPCPPPTSSLPGTAAAPHANHHIRQAAPKINASFDASNALNGSFSALENLNGSFSAFNASKGPLGVRVYRVLGGA
ncbi:hypothetical protein GCM10022247_41690 [Allokutzneria multivorans]|uniref:Uncharacterized protein n=1 Tax=Allokutzneria multivorans TaxID=1142134 RepID=A0ABP7SP22_9PSEU